MPKEKDASLKEKEAAGEGVAASPEEQQKAQHLQQRYMELQLLDQQLKQVQAQMSQYETQAMELEAAQEHLESMKQVKQGQGMLVPIISGVFVKVKIEDSDNVRVGVGANTVVEKSLDDAKAMLANQATEVRKAQEQLGARFQQMAQMAQSTEQQLRKLVEGS